VSRPMWPNTDKRRLLMKSVTGLGIGVFGIVPLI